MRAAPDIPEPVILENDFVRLEPRVRQRPHDAEVAGPTREGVGRVVEESGDFPRGLHGIDLSRPIKDLSAEGAGANYPQSFQNGRSYFLQRGCLQRGIRAARHRNQQREPKRRRG